MVKEPNAKVRQVHDVGAVDGREEQAPAQDKVFDEVPDDVDRETADEVEVVHAHVRGQVLVAHHVVARYQVVHAGRVGRHERVAEGPDQVPVQALNHQGLPAHPVQGRQA